MPRVDVDVDAMFNYWMDQGSKEDNDELKRYIESVTIEIQKDLEF